MTAEVAKKEWKRAKETGDDLSKRQACEKAWLAVVEETDRALGLAVRGPAANAVRRRALREADPSLHADFDVFQRRLHGACFYEWNQEKPDEREVEALIDKVDEYAARLRKTRERE